jgi:hypothetical protein
MCFSFRGFVRTFSLDLLGSIIVAMGSVEGQGFGPVVGGGSGFGLV